MKFLTQQKNKLHFFVGLGVSLTLFFFYGSSTLAAINPEINYQGKLVDDAGALVADGAYSMVFRLYTTATSGTPIWSETQSVTVGDGLFSVLLGEVSSLSAVDFDQTLYLGVEVASDGEMTPRKRIGSVPTAFVAETANDAELLSGLASSSFVRSDAEDTMSASSSGSLLSVVQSGSGDVLSLFSGATEIFTAANDGNIGIGTTTPSSKLTVAGDLYVTGAFRDSSNSAGTSGYVLLSTGTGTDWVATSSLGISGGGGSLFTDGGATTYLTSLSDNLAIGTTTATQRLAVNGSLDLVGNGAVYFNGTSWIRADTALGSTYIGAGAAGMNDTNAFGTNAGQFSGGGRNNFFGLEAGQNSSGDGANFFGAYAGAENSGGENNFFGFSAGQYSEGSFNNFLGYFTGDTNTGEQNNAIGREAGRVNTGNNNNFLGAFAGVNLQATSSDIIGAYAFEGVGTYQAVNNVALGYRAGASAQTGADNNILLGYQAGDNLTTGANNIALGYDVDLPSAGGSNQLTIGNLIFGTGIDGTGTTLSTGNIGIGTTTPSSKLTVAGDLYVTGAFRDSSNSAGTSGYVLLSTGTGTDWVATSSLGISGGGGSGVTTVYKNSAEIVNSSNTLQDDDELFFSVGAGEQWTYRFILLANSATAADFRFAVTGPTGATCRYGVQDVEGAVSKNATTCGGAITAIAGNGNTAATEDVYEIAGSITTATTSGLVRIQWAQDASNASDTTVHPGSYLVAYPVGAAGGGGSVWSQNGADAYYTSGNVGIGTPTPTQDLHVAGNARIEGALYDNSNSAGTSGYVLQSSGTGFSWVATSSLGISGGGGGTLAGLSDVTLSSPASGEFLSYNGSAWVNVAAPSGGSLFTDSGTLTYLTSTGDNLAIGTSSQIGSARLSVNGDIAIPLGSAFMVGTESVLRKYDGPFFGPTNIYVGSAAGSLNTAAAFYNTALGQDALIALTDGTLNTALGAGTLQSLTTGGDNVAVGAAAMQNGGGGFSNTAVGRAALNNNTGNDNTAVGGSALFSNTSGQENTAIGNSAMYNNTTGTYNVAIGKNALQANVSSGNSVAIGFNALTNSTAGDNTAIGISSLSSNTTGTLNLGLGGYSLQSNTTGSNNVALGAFALASNVGGSENVAIGDDALSSNISGEYNVAIGQNSGRDITGAAASGANTTIGFNTGRGITTGTNNTIIGANVTGLTSTLSNTVILADGSGNQRLFIDSAGDVGIKQTAPNTALHVGGTGVTDGTNLLTLQDANSSCVLNADTGSPTCGSDSRLKKDISRIENELDTILALEPKFWRFKSDSSDDERTLRSGFIAQEVEAVLPELVSENTWIDGSQKKFLNISGMIPYIVGAIKELWEEVRENRSRIDVLEAKIEALEAELGATPDDGGALVPSGGGSTGAEGDGSGEGGGASPTDDPTDTETTAGAGEEGISDANAGAEEGDGGGEHSEGDVGDDESSGSEEGSIGVDDGDEVAPPPVSGESASGAGEEGAADESASSEASSSEGGAAGGQDAAAGEGG